MVQPSMPAPYAAPRPPGPRLLTSFIVMGIGIVIGIVAVVAIAIPFAGSLTSPTYIVPGDLNLHLHHARYTVYQHTETRSVFGSATPDPGLVELQPAWLSVTAPDGTTVPVSFDDNNETLTRGHNVYRGALTFDAPSSGTYLLRFTNPTRTTIIVSRSLLDALRGVWVWFGVGAFGGFLLVVGLVMLIVGVTRRGRAKRAMYGGWGPPPPQWGPPPQQWGPPPTPGGPPPPWSPPPGG